MMELLQTRSEQESIRSDLTKALDAIHELPNVIARKGEGAAAMWGPDGGDLFEQVGQAWQGAMGVHGYAREGVRRRDCGLTHILSPNPYI